MANEKQVLIEALKKYHDAKFTPGVYEHSIFGKAALLLEKSVEVVRCKDCKHMNRKSGNDTVGYLCVLHSCDREGHERYLYVEDNDFCSCGERK